MNKEIELKEEKISKLLLKYSIPSILSTLLFSLYNLVDRIFIGQSGGRLAIAGVSLTFPVFSLIIAFGALIGIGSASLISIRLGEGQREQAHQLLGNAVAVYFVVSVLITLFGSYFLIPFLKLFGASPQTLPYAFSYMRIIIPGCFFYFMAVGMNNLVRSEGSPKIAMRCSITGALINLIFDPVFIFYFDLGVKGAAYATVLANITSGSMVLYHFFAGQGNLKLELSRIKVNLSIFKSAVKIGFAPFLMYFAISLVTVTSNKALGRYGGDIAISAMGVIFAVNIFIIMPIVGISQGAQPIIGFNYGAENYIRVKETLKLALTAAFAISSCAFILIQCFPRLIVSLFIRNDFNLIKVASEGMTTYLFFAPIIGAVIITANYFLAIGQPKKSLFLNMLRQVLFYFPLLYILPGFWGVRGVWLVGPVSDFLTALVIIVFLIKEWKILGEKQNSGKAVLSTDRKYFKNDF